MPGNEDADWPQRRRLRLRDYDYSQAGAYAVTICTQGGAFLFGHVSDGTMHLSAAGRVVERVWNRLPEHYPHVELDTFVVMPDHVHGVIVLADAPLCAEEGFEANRRQKAGPDASIGRRAGLRPAPTQEQGHTSVREPGGWEWTGARVRGRRAGLRPAPTKSGVAPRHGLSEVVRGFKSFSGRRVNELRGTPGVALWQRGYFEHVVRNEEDLNRIRQYIVENPLRWSLKRERPEDGLQEAGSR